MEKNRGFLLPCLEVFRIGAGAAERFLSILEPYFCSEMQGTRSVAQTFGKKCATILLCEVWSLEERKREEREAHSHDKTHRVLE